MDNVHLYNRETLFCPYCRNDISDRIFEDGEMKTVTCERCGGVFEYEVGVEYSFDITGIKPGRKPSLDQEKIVKKKILNTVDNNQAVVEVDAEEVKLPGWEEFRFYLRINIDDWQWIVFEESTGQAVIWSSSREDAIDRALDNLNRLGKEKVAEVIARQPKISERERGGGANPGRDGQ